MIYDVAIIGAGIIGSCIARELSKYKINICMIDKADDVACGTSKANSGIIHGGFDAKPGTLMAKLNVEGTAMYPELSQQLHFDYKNNGSLVVAFCDEDMEHIKKLYQRGKDNGVEKLRIIEQEELRRLEPNISEEAVGALLSETAGIVSPYQATWAFAENALMNGVKVFLEQELHSISVPKKNGDNFILHTGRFDIEAKKIVNAAGLFADEISAMAGARDFIIKPRKGEYYLLDNKCGNLANHTLFQTPDKMGKGILVTPTVDGNILSGPTALDLDDKYASETTALGQEQVFQKSEKTIPNIPRRNVINSFAGLRAIAYNSDGSPVNDFIIEEDSKVKGFINVAGICSPGLSAAPAIGKYVAALVEKSSGKKFEENKDFIAVRKGIESFKTASDERKAQLIENNPLYGRMICRCESITEAEIVAAIKSPLGARDLDGVKRRTRAGMGRCQSGFCSPRVTEIISRELNIPMTSVTKNGGCSYILNSKTR
ncbi:MAG: FAD-dependent oxidoreductase [Treponema sp.]|nr:FAD-dependent oxidoreductase [Treponema sp.]